jgi:N,N-dimethylformamidase
MTTSLSRSIRVLVLPSRSRVVLLAALLTLPLGVRVVCGQASGVRSSPSPPPPPAVPASADWITLTGYADRLSVRPGETIRFMISSDVPRYRADIVRLIHGDTNSKGPGFKEEVVETPAGKEYDGHRQRLSAGSYVQVPDAPALRLTGSFTIQAWIASTTPLKGAQGIVTKWSETDRVGYGLFIDEDGSLALWLGDKDGLTEKVRTGKPLTPAITASRYLQLNNLVSQGVNTTSWYFVAATYDARAGRVVLYQEPAIRTPLDETSAVVERDVKIKSVGGSPTPLLLAAAWDWRDASVSRAGALFNGKIESPRLFGRALSKDEIDALKQGAQPKRPIAAWDFSADVSSHRVTDTSASKLHGQTVNMPTRAMTGHSWSGRELRFTLATSQYGAIYFHDDDLDDARWNVDFALTVPDSMRSGVYAARIRAGNREDHIPFYVRPKKDTATSKIAFLAPTLTYLAYGNNRSGVPQLLSLYSFHSDGSGVSYASRLRPIMEFRPKFANRYPRHFAADLYLTNWLEAKGYQYDVITDHDLHAEGAPLLSRYKVVITGSHPEYWSMRMMDGLKAYLENGGRAMYMGGNGFYWITSQDPQQPHIIEVRRQRGTETWDAAPGEGHHSTTGEQGGLWRFRGRPPQQLVGVGFTAQGGGRGVPYQRQAASFDPRVAFIFEGIGPNEKIGDFPSLVREYGAASDEVDRLDYSLGSPPHALVVATATGLDDYFQHVTEEVLLSDSLQGGTVNPLVKADMVFFETPKGGAVFTVGAISWYGALSSNNYSNTVSRVTENVLKRFVSDAPFATPRPTTGNGESGHDNRKRR